MEETTDVALEEPALKIEVEPEAEPQAEVQAEVQAEAEIETEAEAEEVKDERADVSPCPPVTNCSGIAAADYSTLSDETQPAIAVPEDLKDEEEQLEVNRGSLSHCCFWNLI